MTFLPGLPVAGPLLIAALLAGLRGLIPRRVSFWTALATALGTLVVCVLLCRASTAGMLVYWFGNWRPRNGFPLGICFAIDTIGSGLAVLVCTLTAAALIFASKYFDPIGTLFHVLLLAFMGAMCGFALTGDLFNLFVFFELMSAAAYALCGYKTEDPAPVQGALNFAITNTVGAYLILVGLGLAYARTGALNMAQIGRVLDGGPADPLVIASFTLIACGFLVKAAVVPLHFWLADAHAVAPAPVCLLFSGVMVELGLYGVARVYWTMFAGAFAPHGDAVRMIFAVGGIATALLGAGMCFSERNLKRLLAFSTISHMGLMAIGFAMLNSTALAGSAVYAIGHAGAKGGLFLAAGIVLHRTQSVDEVELHGRLRDLRRTAFIFLCGAAGLAGIPFSGINVGAALLRHGAIAANYGWTDWLVVACDAVTSAAVLRFMLRTFAGLGQPDPHRSVDKIEEKPDTESGHTRTPGAMWVPALALAVASLLMGASASPGRAALSAAARFVDHTGYESSVLDGAVTPVPILRELPSSDVPGGAVGIGAAIALSLAAVFTPRRRRRRGLATDFIRAIRDLQSGHVGDYVSWLTFGAALLSAAAILSLRS
jgi:multicomponent Na+:H+ antiporter subunit D